MATTDLAPAKSRTAPIESLLHRPWPELAVLLVAVLTRAWRLQVHSIWFDESVSLKWARSDASYIWQTTFPLVQDKHPPLYYLYLHYWMSFLARLGLATNDAALRLSGSLLGVLTVAGIMLLAGRLASRWTGILTGALVALAPILVWYSQELRMFQPAATAIVWAAVALCYAWNDFASRRRYGGWLLFAAALIAALYTYLFSAFVLPAAGLTLALLAYQRRSLRFFVEGCIALALVTLAFLPLANNAWLVNASESTPSTAFAHFAANTRRLAQVFTIWRAPWPPSLVSLAVAVYGLLALVGLALPRRAPASQTRLSRLDLDQVWLIVWLFTPFLIANFMLSRSGSIFDEDRYLLFLAPFFLWAVARGVIALADYSRVAGWVAAAASVLPLALALPVLWTPSMARENWRAAADAIAEYGAASPGLPEAVIALVDYTHDPLEWYLRQQASFEEIPVFFPFGGTLHPEDVESVIAPPLLGLVDFGTHTAWLTQSHLEGVDDERLVESWFAEHYPIVTELYPAGIKVTAYALHYRYPELPVLNDRAARPETELAPGIVLAACELISDSVSATDDALHPPSGWAHVRLWWRADEPVGEDYTTTAQIVGPDGIWGDRLHRENEVLQRWPTSQWLPGEYVREELDINLNPLTPPGSYSVMVGLNDASGSGVTPPVSCGEIEVR